MGLGKITTLVLYNNITLSGKVGLKLTHKEQKKLFKFYLAVEIEKGGICVLSVKLYSGRHKMETLNASNPEAYL